MQRKIPPLLPSGSGSRANTPGSAGSLRMSQSSANHINRMAAAKKKAVSSASSAANTDNGSVSSSNNGSMVDMSSLGEISSIKSVNTTINTPNEDHHASVTGHITTGLLHRSNSSNSINSTVNSSFMSSTLLPKSQTSYKLNSSYANKTPGYARGSSAENNKTPTSGQSAGDLVKNIEV
jgi:hypothetical protein